jgi:penicillin-binding protein 2
LPIASLLEELYLTDTIKRPQLVEQVKNLPYYLPRRYQDVKK